MVTGGAGYIGSHTCKALARAGYVPVAYDDLSSGRPDAVKWGPLEIGQLEDEVRLAEVLSEHDPVAVLHLAGAIEAGRSVLDPAHFYRANVMGSLALLRVMCAFGVGDIVFSSSAAVYGDPGVTPISEILRPAPQTPYGRSKAMVEDILSDFAAAYGIRYCALRYFNAAGADPEGELREDHDPETHLIPLVIKAAAEGQTVSIFGADYDTPDGTCIRDYVHVADVAEAHVKALRRLQEGGGNLIANIATGRGYSVREVIAVTQRVVGQPVRVRETRRRPGDPATLIACPKLALREMGWTPKYAELQQMIAHAAQMMPPRESAEKAVSNA